MRISKTKKCYRSLTPVTPLSQVPHPPNSPKPPNLVNPCYTATPWPPPSPPNPSPSANPPVWPLPSSCTAPAQNKTASWFKNWHGSSSVSGGLWRAHWRECSYRNPTPREARLIILLYMFKLARRLTWEYLAWCCELSKLPMVGRPIEM